MGKDISIILPCYNEETIFEQSMRKILNLLQKTKFNYEIVLVDDFSKDNTRELIKKTAAGNKNIRYIFHEKNMGRGKTVSDGIRMASGRIAGYIDIDLEISEENILSHALAIEEGYDIAYADRITGLNMSNLMRHFLHAAYIMMVRVFLGFSFGDTNAGCKFFNRKKILPILEKVEDNHWFWDTEILLRGYGMGLKIKKIPVLYLKNEGKKSTVRTFSDTLYFMKKIMQYRGKI